LIPFRAAAAWSAAGLVVVVGSTDPVYRVIVAAGAVALLLRAGRRRGLSRGLLVIAGVSASSAIVLSFTLSHVGSDRLFSLPAWLPGVGGPYTLEALAFGADSGVALVAALLLVAPLSTLYRPEQVVDALPPGLERTGVALAASINLVPGVARSFTAIVEAQRMRGWHARRPSSWRAVGVPLVLTTMEDSLQLAEAMEARAFGSGARTRLAADPLGLGGLAVVAAALAAAGLFLAGRLAGWITDWEPYPSLVAPPISPLGVAAGLLLAAPALLARADLHRR
jgi:energy-coupling factor transport system permease protein